MQTPEAKAPYEEYLVALAELHGAVFTYSKNRTQYPNDGMFWYPSKEGRICTGYLQKYRTAEQYLIQFKVKYVSREEYNASD